MKHVITRTERPDIGRWGFECSCGEKRDAPIPEIVDSMILHHLVKAGRQ